MRAHWWRWKQQSSQIFIPPLPVLVTIVIPLIPKSYRGRVTFQVSKEYREREREVSKVRAIYNFKSFFLSNE